jgi:predicted tellurium resistance membrane protein TerC
VRAEVRRLGFVGLKMLLKAVNFEIPIGNSLFIIALILGLSIVASLHLSYREKKAEETTLVDHGEALDETNAE